MSTTPQHCNSCDREYEDIADPHWCADCETEISVKWCAEHSGLCEQCEWLLDK